MRKNHTNIPWPPIMAPRVFEGYKAFVKRQQDRLEAVKSIQVKILRGVITC